jgi:hypothetical protein
LGRATATTTRIMTLTGHHLTVCTGTIPIILMHAHHMDIGVRIISMTVFLLASAHGSGGDLGRASVADSAILKTFVGLAVSKADASEISETTAVYAISGVVKRSAVEHRVAGAFEVERPTTASAVEHRAAGAFEVERPTTASAVEHRVVGASEVERPTMASTVEHRAVGASEVERPTTASTVEHRAVGASVAGHPVAVFTVERPAAVSTVVQQVASTEGAEAAAPMAVAAATAADATNSFFLVAARTAGDTVRRAAVFAIFQTTARCQKPSTKSSMRRQSSWFCLS